MPKIIGFIILWIVQANENRFSRGRRRTNHICKAFFEFRANSCPFSHLFMALKIIFLAPVRTTPTPKIEEHRKSLARKTFKFVNHEANILARDRKTEHPTREMIDTKIFCSATKACLEDETNGVFIETNRRATKASDEMES